jgi:hypothetical protein
LRNFLAVATELIGFGFECRFMFGKYIDGKAFLSVLRKRLQQQGERRGKTAAERYFSCWIGLFWQRFTIAMAIVGKFDEVGIVVERGREKCVNGGHQFSPIR